MGRVAPRGRARGRRTSNRGRETPTSAKRSRPRCSRGGCSEPRRDPGSRQPGDGLPSVASLPGRRRLHRVRMSTGRTSYAVGDQSPTRVAVEAQGLAAPGHLRTRGADLPSGHRSSDDVGEDGGRLMPVRRPEGGLFVMFDKQLTVRMGQANVRRWVDDLLPLVLGDADPLGTEGFATHRLPLRTHHTPTRSSRPRPTTRSRWCSNPDRSPSREFSKGSETLSPQPEQRPGPRTASTPRSGARAVRGSPHHRWRRTAELNAGAVPTLVRATNDAESGRDCRGRRPWPRRGSRSRGRVWNRRGALPGGPSPGAGWWAA